MLKTKTFLFASALGALWTMPLSAGICDYRLSKLIGSFGSSGAVATTAAVAASDVGMKAAGFYLITNATTGATMIGSTAAGVSGAGTVGIIGGTAGLLGTAASIVTAPVTIVVAGVTALATLGVEGGCYFADERITDPKQIYDLLNQLVSSGSPTDLGIVMGELDEPWFWRKNDAGEIEAFALSNLYIVNGTLMNRDWFANTKVGDIAVVMAPIQ